MAVMVKKESGNETNEHLIGRFKKAVRGARIIQTLKKERFHLKKPTKRQVRARAIMREYYRALRKREGYTK